MKPAAAFDAGASLLDMAGEDAWLDMALGTIASFSTWERLQAWLIDSLPATLRKLHGADGARARIFEAVKQKKIALFTAETVAGIAAAQTHREACDAFFSRHAEWRHWPEEAREKLWSAFMDAPPVVAAREEAAARINPLVFPTDLNRVQP